MKRILVVICFLVAFSATSQERTKLSKYLQEISNSQSVEFVYRSEWIDDIYVERSSVDDFRKVLFRSLPSAGLKILEQDSGLFIIYPNKIEFEKRMLLKRRPSDEPAITSIRLGSPETYDENQLYEIRGTVTDDSAKPLGGVNISIDGEAKETTNSDGKYEIFLRPGNYQVKFSYVGLEQEERLLNVYGPGSVDLSLFPDSELLDEVVVESNLLQEDQGLAQVGVQKLSVEKLERIPSFLGNVDVVKSAISLPGITTSGESSSYLNVRGGANDQTLVLMNGTTIYNPGHLLGFFSVFNGDMVSDMAIYKGNIPAKYGMRSSAVLDVKMNKWATKKSNIYGGIGLFNSNLGVKTKLLEEKLDLHVGGRLSYLDWILGFANDKDVNQSSVRFGDVNLSSKYLLDGKNSLFFHSFFGSDFFNYGNRAIYRWNTFNNALRWSHLFDNEWVYESELKVSSLRNQTEGLEINDQFIYENGISEYTFQNILSSDQFETGIELTNYSIDQGSISRTAASSLSREGDLTTENLLNVAVFYSHFFSPFNGLEINPGLRFNYFMNYGKQIINQYGNGAPFTQENVVGNQSFEGSELLFNQAALEPRLGVKYRVNQHTLRGSYARVNQFLHLISNTVLVNPATVWKGSDSFIPPTTIDQYSVGYQYDVKEEDISISLDGFYKEMTNMVEYRNGASLILNDDLEQELVRGRGRSYGFEFLISKNKGAFSGIASYTYSRTLITVQDELQRVEINDGEEYPFYTDRPHSIKSSVDWKVTKKWTISTNFTYITGAPITAPGAIYEVDGVPVPYFLERNRERIPDYHRLDLVITLKSRIRKTKKNNDRWVLTLYNLYGRENIANIFFSENDLGPSQPFSLVNVGRMIPTLTYKFEF